MVVILNYLIKIVTQSESNIILGIYPSTTKLRMGKPPAYRSNKFAHNQTKAQKSKHFFTQLKI